ncbi:MAG: helicase-exonuclease AddAB subunit AddA [Oscillospiraceae bacterium]|nr:helicase-exonuclease AddAB subunit AddA [Oscillospiraceae bacterium]
MGWTKQQEDAINSTDRSVIVSAAAGSGKTAVLVERVIRLITNPENPVSADRIIIVTFTKDAAAELRQRLNVKIQEKINKNPDNRFLLKQYILFQNAKISTIDSFCFDIIRNNSEKLDITSGFSVLDETRGLLLESQSAEETMQLWSSEHTKEYSFLYDKFCTRDDSGIKDVILEINKFLGSMPDRNLWLENTKNEFLKDDLKDTVYYQKFIESSRLQLKTAKSLAEKNELSIPEIFRFADDEKIQDMRKKLEKNIEEDLNIIDSCINSLKTGKVPEVKFSQLTRGVKNLSPHYADARDKYKAIVSDYESSADAILKDIEETKDVFLILYDMMFDFYRIIWEHKCRKDTLSFDDGEKLVIQMLSEYDKNDKTKIVPSAFARELSEKYDVIMIDEYQDSNNKQDIIFKFLSRNFSAENNQYGENVFLVGDVKQAIYQFRLANPDNFINTLKSSEPYSKASDSMNVSISLNKNFRSSPEVIDYVNYVFENLMSKKCGDMEYTENEKLYFGADAEYPEKNPERKTQIIIFESNEDIPEDSEDNQYDESLLEDVTVESEAVAETISRMIKEKYPVSLRDGRKRPCEPKDFCILLREAKYSSSAFIESLKRRGVYAKGEEKKGYLKSREIVILLDILRIIDNPLLDIPAVAVMMSPMFVFNAQEISEIRAVDMHQPIYLNVQKICEPDYEATEELKEKCINFQETIKTFRMYSIVYTLEELIEKIYDTTDFLSIMQQFIDGERKKANLRTLMQYAKNYESNSTNESGGGLSGFLRYIDIVQSNKTDFAQGKISALSENFVSIKTIHKSKGLEYPFVFLARTDIKFKTTVKKPVICGQNNTIGFRLNEPHILRCFKTVPFDMLAGNMKKKIISEELRLLYVALTRAKQKLFITLNKDARNSNMGNKLRITELFSVFQANKFDIKETALYAQSLGDWIWLTIMANEKFSDINNKYNLSLPTKEVSPVFKDNLFDISYFSSSDIQKENKKSENSEFNVNPEIVKSIENIMNYQYDFTRSKISSTMSVTQLISMNDASDEEDIILKKPAFLMSDVKSADGSQRGSAIHTFLQFFDIDSGIEDIECEIQEMADKNYLSEDEARLIETDKIKGFFKSSVYKRMKSAVKIERERKFTLEMKDLSYKPAVQSDFIDSDGLIRGIVDLIIHEPDGLVIVDYKSNRGLSEKGFINKYYEQLAIYKSAVELIYGQNVKECIIYSIELQKEIKL